MTLGVIVKAQSNRCDDTVQDNCIVNDNQSADCKAFLSNRGADQQSAGWPGGPANQPGLVWDEAVTFCREQGARLMKVSNWYDLTKLGTDPLTYGGHHVMITEKDADGNPTGNFHSYDEPLDANMWTTGEPSGGNEHCGHVVTLPHINGDVSPHPLIHYLVNDVDCASFTRPYICEKHVETRDLILTYETSTLAEVVWCDEFRRQ